MTTKFKNRRKRSTSEEVQIKKRPKSVLTNYLPSKGDNFIEVETQVRKMRDEGHSMSDEEVAKAMAVTLADRRHRLIGSKKQGLKDLLNRYPILESESELWCELARLRGRTETEGGQSVRDESRAKFTDILERIQALIGCAPDEAASYACSMFMEEGAVFVQEAPSSGPPVVLMKHSLVVEGVVVCRLESITVAEQLLTWAASFAVYAQKPAVRKYENVACLLTRFVMGTDLCKVPKKLDSVLAKLNL